MRHPLDRSVASDYSQAVLQLRAQRGELGPCVLDSANKHLYAIPSLIAHRRRFVPDVDEFSGDAANPNPPMRPPF